MADQSNDGGSFTRAFLPGLILGLVVGGLAGAFLPDILGSRSLSPIEVDPNAAPAERDAGPTTEELIEQARHGAEQAGETIEDAANDAAEDAENLADDAADAVEDLTGDDQP